MAITISAKWLTIPNWYCHYQARTCVLRCSFRERKILFLLRFLFNGSQFCDIWANEFVFFSSEGFLGFSFWNKIYTRQFLQKCLWQKSLLFIINNYIWHILIATEISRTYGCVYMCMCSSKSIHIYIKYAILLFYRSQWILIFLWAFVGSLNGDIFFIVDISILTIKLWAGYSLT